MSNLSKKDLFVERYIGNLTFKGQKSNSVKMVDKVYEIMKYKNLNTIRKDKRLKNFLNISPFILSQDAFEFLYPYVGVKKLRVGRSKKIKRYIYLPMRLKDKRKMYVVFQWCISQERRNKGVIYKRGVSIEDIANNWLNVFKNKKNTNILKRKENLLQLLIENKYRMKRVRKRKKIIFKNIKPKEWLPLEPIKFLTRLTKKRLRKRWKRKSTMLKNFLKVRRIRRVIKVYRESKKKYKS